MPQAAELLVGVASGILQIRGPLQISNLCMRDETFSNNGLCEVSHYNIYLIAV